MLTNRKKEEYNEEYPADLHIDVSPDTIKSKGIMAAIKEKEKQAAKEKKKEMSMERKKAIDSLKSNMFGKWFTNVKNIGKNVSTIKASPYASLVLALKLRKIVIAIIIPIIAFIIFKTIRSSSGSGIMGIVSNLVMAAVGAVICFKLWSTIPQAKKQIEYYKKFPHLINYCPTNTKETIDSIMDKIKENKNREENIKKTR